MRLWRSRVAETRWRKTPRSETGDAHGRNLHAVVAGRRDHIGVVVDLMSARRLTVCVEGGREKADSGRTVEGVPLSSHGAYSPVDISPTQMSLRRSFHLISPRRQARCADTRTRLRGLHGRLEPVNGERARGYDTGGGHHYPWAASPARAHWIRASNDAVRRQSVGPDIVECPERRRLAPDDHYERQAKSIVLSFKGI